MTTIEIPAPPSLGALLVLSTEMKLTHEQADALRAQGESIAARIRAARDSGEWPVVVVCDMALTVEWIPAPVRVRMPGEA